MEERLAASISLRSASLSSPGRSTDSVAMCVVACFTKRGEKIRFVYSL